MQSHILQSLVVSPVPQTALPGRQMDILSKDFVSLPIIVTDWDAMNDAKSHVQSPVREIERSRTTSKIAHEPEKPALNESFEEIWGRISSTTKAKIREAAMEVLRRTDTSEKLSFQYDDDARFLD